MASKISLRQAFRAIDTDNSGYIEKSELGRLMQSMDPSHTVTQNDVLFALKEIDSSDDGRVSFEEFKVWWIRTTKGHKGSKYNKLLVKDLVGKSRTSSYDLPSKQFTFGYVIPRDVSDAKDVISNWQSGKQRVSGSQILKARDSRGAPSRSTTYGHVNRPSTPMGKLIQGEFAGTASSSKEREYPERPVHPTVLRKHEQTMKERRAVDEAAAKGRAMRRSNNEAHTDGTWKMRKFAHVRSKVFS